MSLSGIALLAARPTSAEVAALFCVDPPAPIVLRRPCASRPSLPTLARRVMARLRDAALSQVPCEDFALTRPAAHAPWVRTQM